jgi:hypothetical protein
VGDLARGGHALVIPDAPRLTLARLVAGYGAIACALPYLALKVVWLAGGTLGVAEGFAMRDPSMFALNLLTAGMDLVGIGVALAFTHTWGLRIPAWLLLPPIWVATGLLLRFVVAVPTVALVNALSSNSMSIKSGPVQPWVYVVVYTEFTGLGIGLMVAFVLYARVRWPEVWRRSTTPVTAAMTHVVQVPLANTAALIAMAVGLLHLLWAAGLTIGLGEQIAVRRSFVSSLIKGLDGLLEIGAAAGVLALVHRLGSRIPFWVPLALTWVGAGALFAWGGWSLINVLGNTALVRGQAQRMALVNFVALLSLIAGLVIGLVMLFVLAERRAADVSSRQA